MARDKCKANADRANADTADVDKANADKADADKANADKANADKANAGKTNADKANANQANADEANKANAEFAEACKRSKAEAQELPLNRDGVMLFRLTRNHRNSQVVNLLTDPRGALAHHGWQQHRPHPDDRPAGVSRERRRG